MKPAFHIAGTVCIEALRRKEIYVVVLVATALIALVMSLDFFGMDGLTKIYREFSLKAMSIATAITVIILSARQLPREFETRTIYPLLARPISRTTFLFGKLLGVWLAAAFCFALFMLVYTIGITSLHGSIEWPLFLQYIYLQMIMMLLLATLGLMLSMMYNVDAAITFAVLLFALGSTLTSITTYIYDLASPLGQKLLLILTYLIPQIMLFDLSEKSIHAEVWNPLTASTMLNLTLYGLFFSSIYFGITTLLFRKKAL